MKIILCALTFILCCCGPTVIAHGQTSRPGGELMLSAEEKKEIVAVLSAFEDAWAKRDMAAFRAMLTEDCDWVNIVGMHWHGRDEVTEMHRVLLEGRYKGVNVHTLSHEESEIAPGVALVVQKSLLDDFTTPDGQSIKGLKNMGIMILVKREGKWLVRASENSSIDPRASMKPPATPSIVAQSSGEDNPIQTFFANADVAWNNHDARQLTNPQNATADADFVNVYGGWAKGMEPFGAIMTKLQAGPFHNVHRQTIVEKIRFVRPDVAVVITTIVDRHGDGPPASTRGTFVLSKEDGRWLLNSFQNTQITAPPERVQAPQSQSSSPH